MGTRTLQAVCNARSPCSLDQVGLGNIQIPELFVQMALTQTPNSDLVVKRQLACKPYAIGDNILVIFKKSSKLRLLYCCRALKSALKNGQTMQHPHYICLRKVRDRPLTGHLVARSSAEWLKKFVIDITQWRRLFHVCSIQSEDLWSKIKYE